MNAKKLLLQSILSQTELAHVLGIKEDLLVTVSNRAPSLYRAIRIKKDNGTNRIIHAPNDLLKSIQRSILDKILITTPLPKCAYGFGKGKGIVDNARLHAKNPYLLNADIKDFFPSVHFSRVYKLLVGLGSKSSTADVLTKLTTLNYALPQGAPTSPYLASLVLGNLDRRILLLCMSNRLTYSRYFDDITISGNEHAHKVLTMLEKIINSEGYQMHKDSDKLRLVDPTEEKLVTGILIRDGKLIAPDSDSVYEYVLLLQKKGMAGLKDDNPTKEETSLRGKISFIKQVDPALGLRIETDFEKISW